MLKKQGITLDKFNDILTTGNFDSQQTQDLFRQISGLYKQENTPESRKPGKSQEVIDTAKIDSGLNSLSNNSRIKTYVTPNQRGASADDLMRAKTDINFARDLGLTTTQTGADEVVPAGTRWVLDPTAVDALKTRVAGEQAGQQQIYDLSQDRYIKALKGQGPVSAGLLDQKNQDFILLKEAAARRGVQIDGDSPETATSQTTAGNELVGQFKRTYGLLEGAERQAELTGVPPMPGGSYGTALNYAAGNAAAGPSSLLPSYAGLSQMYAGAGQPYANQRLMGYQSQVAGYNAGRSALGGITGLLGTGGGYALMAGHPLLGLGLLGLGTAASQM